MYTNSKKEERKRNVPVHRLSRTISLPENIQLGVLHRFDDRVDKFSNNVPPNKLYEESPSYSCERDDYYDFNSDTFANSVITTSLPRREQEEEEQAFKRVNGSLPVSEKVKTIRDGLRYIVPWTRLFALMSLFGKARFTKDTYEILQEAFATISEGSSSVPTFKTVKSKQLEYFKEHCLPHSIIVHLEKLSHPSSLNQRIKLIKTTTTEEDVRECIQLVLPTSWAKFDISLYHIYKELYSCHNIYADSNLSIERSPITTSRAAALGTVQTFWVQNNGYITHCKINSEVEISTKYITAYTKPPDLWPSRQSANNKGEELYIIKGRVGPQWCVRHINGTQPYIKEPDETLMDNIEKFVYHKLKKAINSIDEKYNQKHTSKEGSRNSADCPAGKMKRNDSDRRYRGMRTMVTDEDTELLETLYMSTENSGSSFLSIYPSDICTIIRPQKTSKNHDFICLLVSSIVSIAVGESAERLIWIQVRNKKKKKGDHVEEKQVFPIVLQTVVTDIPLLLHESDTAVGEETAVKNTGVLDDGTPYVIYRAAFYADEFKEKRSLGNVRNVCGIYLRPLGFNNRVIRCSAAIRVITLTAHCQNSNLALTTVVKDIVEGTIYGVDGVDAYGKRVKIFLDIPIFYGDYLKMSAVTDTLGHSANCFCTYCVLQKDTNSQNPKFISTTAVHTRRLGFMRCDDRYNILRSMNLSRDVKTILGFKSSAEEANNIPLLLLSNMLREKAHKIRKNSLNQEIIQPVFDSYRSTAVAPDHLLSGLALNTLCLCFEAIKNPIGRSKLEAQILSAASSNGLQLEGYFVQHKKGRFTGFKSLSMSTLYKILMISVHYFEILAKGYSAEDNPFLLPKKLHSYISLFYYWPTKGQDSLIDIELVHSSSGKLYLSQLLKYANYFTESTASYLKNRKSTVNFHPDKPNGHRLIELTVHTLPLFGHGLFLSELIFELIHFFFKKWLENNTNPDSHITAVDIALCRSWGMDVFMALHMWKNEEGIEKIHAERTLQRLFFGEKAFEFNQLTKQEDILLGRFQQALPNLFKKPLPRMLKGEVNTIFSNFNYKWIPDKIIPFLDDDEDKINALTSLSLYLDTAVTKIFDEVKFYNSVSLRRIEKYDTGSSTFPHRKIQYGTAVTFMSAGSGNEKVFNGVGSVNGTRVILAVMYIIVFRNVLYVIGNNLKYYNGLVCCRNKDVRVLKLTECVTRVAIVHSCTDKCKVDSFKIISHTGDIFSGENYKVILRSDGYPPHLG